jgi:tetratricopeptide (TPR) repeat protein
MLYDLYEKAARYDEALKLLEPMLERDPTNTYLLGEKGRLLLKLKRYGEALPLLQKADQMAPQNLDNVEGLIATHLKLKDADNSAKRMRELLALNADRQEVKFDMFSNLFDGGFDDHATSLGKETTKPMEIVRYYNNKGVTLSKNGQAEEAMKQYERALRFYPNFKENYRIYYNIALAHIQKKTRAGYAEAQKNLKICLHLDNTFEKAKNTLEQVEKALGGNKKAS